MDVTKIKLGLVGLGVIGQMHLKVVAGMPHVSIVGVCDVRPELVQSTAAQYGITHAYTNTDDLFANPELDGVVLALPANLRADLGVRAFAAGKHVLTEKPVAMNAMEVRRLILARDTSPIPGRIGASCSCRYHGLPSARVVRDFVATGMLGDLRVVRVRAVLAAPPVPPFNPPPIWRLNKALNGGGILMNWGHYDTDYLFGVLGWRLQPKRVMARTFGNIAAYPTFVHPASDAETHIVAFVDCLDTMNGKPAVFTYERGEFTTSATDEAWQIIGDRGTLRLWMKEKVGKQLWLDHPTSKGTVTELLWEGDEDWSQQHGMPIKDFAEAIRDGRAPTTSLERGLIIQSMFDAMYRAADSGRSEEVV